MSKNHSAMHLYETLRSVGISLVCLGIPVLLVVFLTAGSGLRQHNFFCRRSGKGAPTKNPSLRRRWLRAWYSSSSARAASPASSKPASQSRSRNVRFSSQISTAAAASAPSPWGNVNEVIPDAYPVNQTYPYPYPYPYDYDHDYEHQDAIPLTNYHRGPSPSLPSSSQPDLEAGRRILPPRRRELYPWHHPSRSTPASDHSQRGQCDEQTTTSTSMAKAIPPPSPALLKHRAAVAAQRRWMMERYCA